MARMVDLGICQKSVCGGREGGWRLPTLDLPGSPILPYPWSEAEVSSKRMGLSSVPLMERPYHVQPVNICANMSPTGTEFTIYQNKMLPF